MYTSTDRAFIIQGVCSSYWLCSASTGIARHELQHSSFMETDLHSHATQRVKCSPRRSQMQPTVKTSLAKQPPACFFCSSQMQYSLLSEYSSTNSSSLDLYLPCKSTSPPPSSSTMPRAPPPLFLSTSFCFLFFFKKKRRKYFYSFTASLLVNKPSINARSALTLPPSSSLTSTARTSSGGLRPRFEARCHRFMRGMPMQGYEGGQGRGC